MSFLKWLFETNLHFGSKSIAVREIVGGGLGLTSAVLGMRRKVAAWPIGILGDGLLFTVFLGALFSFGDKAQHANFYGQAGRNLLLVLVSIYGWMRWAAHKRANHDEPVVSPRWTTAREKAYLIPGVVAFFFISSRIFVALGESGT